jgi:hypothetical protein
MSLKRHLAWVAVVAVVAAVALPVAVFYTGTATLGPYARGGLAQFVADYVADLASLRAGAWVLLLGPVALVAAWRIIVALAWPRGPADEAQPASVGRDPAPRSRRDPTIGGVSRG